MDDYQQRSVWLKAIAHPIRLQIVDILRQEPECVCHLSAVLAKPQPYMSQQLAILRNAGVIVDEREGANVFYRLADAHIATLVEAACQETATQARTQTFAPYACTCPKCAALPARESAQ